MGFGSDVQEHVHGVNGIPWHWATCQPGEFSWRVGSEAQEDVWAGGRGQKISTEAVMEVLQVAWRVVQRGRNGRLRPALVNTLEHAETEQPRGEQEDSQTLGS